MDQTRHSPVGQTDQQQRNVDTIDPSAKRVHLQSDDASSKGALSGGAGIYDRPDPAAANARRIRRIVALVAILSAVILAVLLVMQSIAPKTS